MSSLVKTIDASDTLQQSLEYKDGYVHTSVCVIIDEM